MNSQLVTPDAREKFYSELCRKEINDLVSRAVAEYNSGQKKEYGRILVVSKEIEDKCSYSFKKDLCTKIKNKFGDIVVKCEYIPGSWDTCDGMVSTTYEEGGLHIKFNDE
jgi:hypothetical protein